MKYVLLFPMNVRITEANLPQAITVNTKSDDDVLQRASDYGRLRCPGCLGKMHVVRYPAEGQVNHFAHSKYADPDCVFRVNWNFSDDENIPPTSRRDEDPRKLIERLLLRELQRNLGDRPNTEIRSLGQRLPTLEIDGLAQKVEILSLTREDAELWVEPFSGRRKDRETLFFIASWDIRSPLLSEVFPNLMSKRPCIVIWPAHHEQLVPLCALTSEQPEGNLSRHLIEEVDIGWVDYHKLLGIDLDGAILFIRKPYRIALKHLERIIETNPDGSPLCTLFQLIAKMLLVEGAEIHKAVFDEDYDIARKPYRECKVFPTSDQLLKIADFALLIERIPEIFAVCEDRILLETAKEFFTGFIKNLESELQKTKNEITLLKQGLLRFETQAKELENEIQQNRLVFDTKITESARGLANLTNHNRELEDDLEIECRKNQELKNNLESERHRNQELKNNLEAEGYKNRELSNEIKKLKDREKVIRAHWLGRRVFKQLESELP